MSELLVKSGMILVLCAIGFGIVGMADLSRANHSDRVQRVTMAGASILMMAAVMLLIVAMLFGLAE